jgi:hypothetical protein
MLQVGANGVPQRLQTTTTAPTAPVRTPWRCLQWGHANVALTGRTGSSTGAASVWAVAVVTKLV